MSNPIRGKIDFDVDGETYSLQYTANGMCELEDAVGCTAMAFLNKLESAGEANLSFKDIRLLFWAGLQEHHPNMSVREAGALMTKAGGIAAAMEMTGKAVADSMPKPDASAGKPKGKKKKGTS
ncbi:GTA-gp10 family protein [Pacificoceanicola onchidii]|uniref:GTA-gp10 family protein n=1 Tax=Pacificoceanicola onchidii TaxID=2562685 RepID=UPI0010A52E31|nr:GTA-gp10 family protein [Pacificoceanicola onchidii]